MSTRKTVVIDGKKIGDGQPVYSIAEIGFNHNGDMELAKRMIKGAKDAGASAVKFQSYLTDELHVTSNPYYEIIKGGEISEAQHRVIFDYAKSIGITFFSTPFDFTSLDILAQLGVPCYKIASMDLNNYDLIHHVASLKKPIILSTGMGTLGEIERAVETIEKTGNTDIVLLHCISKYPPADKDMHLRWISEFRDLFPYPVGLSDHLMHNHGLLVARTLGANAFEKHFTIDKNLPGPDQKLSSDPAELKKALEDIKVIDDLLAGEPTLTKRGDYGNRKGSRRGLYARKNLTPGAKINKENFKFLRPCEGVSIDDYDKVEGKALSKGLEAGQPLTWQNL